MTLDPQRYPEVHVGNYNVQKIKFCVTPKQSINQICLQWPVDSQAVQQSNEKEHCNVIHGSGILGSPEISGFKCLFFKDIIASQTAAKLTSPI